MNFYVIIAIISVILVIVLVTYKVISENKAKENYKPPVPSEKTILPEIGKAKLPAKSEKHLHFCKYCGAANTDQSEHCTNCGKSL